MIHLGGSIKALLRTILGTTLGAILVILSLIVRVLGGAQSALDSFFSDAF